MNRIQDAKGLGRPSGTPHKNSRSVAPSPTILAWFLFIGCFDLVTGFTIRHRTTEGSFEEDQQGSLIEFLVLLQRK